MQDRIIADAFNLKPSDLAMPGQHVADINHKVALVEIVDVDPSNRQRFRVKPVSGVDVDGKPVDTKLFVSFPDKLRTSTGRRFVASLKLIINTKTTSRHYRNIGEPVDFVIGDSFNDGMSLWTGGSLSPTKIPTMPVRTFEPVDAEAAAVVDDAFAAMFDAALKGSFG